MCGYNSNRTAWRFYSNPTACRTDRGITVHQLHFCPCVSTSNLHIHISIPKTTPRSMVTKNTFRNTRGLYSNSMWHKQFTRNYGIWCGPGAGSFLVGPPVLKQVRLSTSINSIRQWFFHTKFPHAIQYYKKNFSSEMKMKGFICMSFQVKLALKKCPIIRI